MTPTADLSVPLSELVGIRHRRRRRTGPTCPGRDVEGSPQGKVVASWSRGPDGNGTNETPTRSGQESGKDEEEFTESDLLGGKRKGRRRDGLGVGAPDSKRQWFLGSLCLQSSGSLYIHFISLFVLVGSFGVWHGPKSRR